MLILTRRPGENIVINDNIVITVLENRGQQVRIGIDAPRSISVHREEVRHEVALRTCFPQTKRGNHSCH